MSDNTAMKVVDGARVTLRVIEGSEQKMKRKSRRRTKRTGMTEQIQARCTKTPHKHHDLKGHSGRLTVTWRNGKPWEITFDPDDRRMDNAIIPVLALSGHGAQVIVASDSGRWVFIDTGLVSND